MISEENINLFKSLLKNVEAELGIKVIFIIYNENKEILANHLKIIKKFLNKTKEDSSIVVLEGIGGDAKCGMKLALELKTKFKRNYFTAVPNFARSALVFPIFSSTALFMDSKGYVSPVEPLIKNSKKKFSSPVSTLYLMKHGDKESAKKAMICWENQANLTLEILETDGSITHIKELKIEQMSEIVKLFLLSPHDEKIFSYDLRKVKFCCWNVEKKEYWSNLKSFTNNIKSELVKDKTKEFIIGDSVRHIIF